jgi:hypothetical membrane protein
MSKKEAITLITGSVFNIVIIVVGACGLTTAQSVLEQIAPEFNTVVLAVLALFGVQRGRQAKQL